MPVSTRSQANGPKPPPVKEKTPKSRANSTTPRRSSTKSEAASNDLEAVTTNSESKTTRKASKATTVKRGRPRKKSKVLEVVEEVPNEIAPAGDAQCQEGTSSNHVETNAAENESQIVEVQAPHTSNEVSEIAVNEVAVVPENSINCVLSPPTTSPSLKVPVHVVDTTLIDDYTPITPRKRLHSSGESSQPTKRYRLSVEPEPIAMSTPIEPLLSTKQQMKGQYDAKVVTFANAVMDTPVSAPRNARDVVPMRAKQTVSTRKPGKRKRNELDPLRDSDDEFIDEMAFDADPNDLDVSPVKLPGPATFAMQGISAVYNLLPGRQGVVRSIEVAEEPTEDDRDQANESYQENGDNDGAKSSTTDPVANSSGFCSII